jgi:hypothetical protein
MKLLRRLTTLSVACAALNACAQSSHNDQQIPGRRDVEQAMMRRLVEIAEDIPPTKEALSKEFGFNYQKSPYFSDERPQFFATANLPFEPGYASTHEYHSTSGSTGARELSFKFAAREKHTDESIKRFCLSQDAFIRTLLKNNWSQQERVFQPHSIKEKSFMKTVGGFNRIVFFFPIQADCVQNLQIRYETSLNSSPTNLPLTVQESQGVKQ